MQLINNMLKWKVLLVTCSIIAISNARTYNITLKADEEFRMNHRKLENDTVAESIWNLETCMGCKFVLSCFLYSRTCDDHLLTIYDGESTKEYCGSRIPRSVLLTSYHNEARVNITTKGKTDGSLCHVSATKPYIFMDSEETDFVDYGLGMNAISEPSCKCGWANKKRGRIVGGEVTAPNEFPFAVMLKVKNKTGPICGGSIITARHVLTAAHCSKSSFNIKLTVVVGDHDFTTSEETQSKEIDVLRAIEHPDYDNHEIFDISILVLNETIEFSQTIGPVCLPSSTGDDAHLGEYIEVIGWGHTKRGGPISNTLRKAKLRVIDIDICRAIYTYVDERNQQQLCTWAPNRDSCQVDSGGPLIWNDPRTNRYTQVGIVSYGNGCATTDAAVNVDVTFFMDWIQKTIAADNTSAQEVCI